VEWRGKIGSRRRGPSLVQSLRRRHFEERRWGEGVALLRRVMWKAWRSIAPGAAAAVRLWDSESKD